MVYSTGKRWAQTVAERDAGITISKSLEASDPSDLAQDALEQDAGEQKSESKGFARPKRPGKR